MCCQFPVYIGRIARIYAIRVVWPPVQVEGVDLKQWTEEGEEEEEGVIRWRKEERRN